MMLACRLILCFTGLPARCSWWFCSFPSLLRRALRTHVSRSMSQPTITDPVSRIVRANSSEWNCGPNPNSRLTRIKQKIHRGAPQTVRSAVLESDWGLSSNRPWGSRASDPCGALPWKQRLSWVKESGFDRSTAGRWPGSLRRFAPRRSPLSWRCGDSEAGVSGFGRGRWLFGWPSPERERNTP
jgi:hypothetical protein